MTTTKYEDGRCEYSSGMSGVVLFTSGMLELFHSGGDEVEASYVFLPDWLADAIREAFIKKIEEEKDKSA